MSAPRRDDPLSRIRALVVDDERLARVGLRRDLEAMDGVEVVGACATGAEAVQAIRESAPDVVLLDVRMPQMNGFEVVREVGVEAMPAVIFVTAHDEHALRAFEVNAVDYVLKPVEPERLRKALRRVQGSPDPETEERLESKLRRLLRRVEGREAIDERGPDGGAARPLERLSVEKSGQISFVEAEDVRWFEAAGNYARLHATTGTFLVRRTMKSLEEDLDSERFLRVRRSAIVNMERVSHLELGDDRRYRIHLEDGTEVHASRRYGETVERYVERHR